MTDNAAAAEKSAAVMIRNLVTVCALALVLSAVTFSPTPARADTPDPVVAKAEALVQAGKDADALNLLNGYLRKNPKDATALAYRGEAYQDMHEEENAIADFTAALAVNADYAFARALRCDGLYRIHQYKGALADCNRAIELSPRYPYAYRQRALTYLSMGDMDAALSDSNQSLTFAPDSAAGYSIRCKVLTTMEKFDHAQPDCDAALKYDSSNYLGRFYSGRLAIEGGRWADAESFFTMILADDSKNTAAMYWRAIARDHLQNYEGALADIGSYVAKYPDDGDGLYHRAIIEHHTGNLEVALTDAAKALRRYRIGNDTHGVVSAQKFIDELTSTGH